MALRHRLSILIVFLAVTHAAGPTLAQEDEPGHYAGRDAAWWVGQLADREGGYQAAMVAFKKIGRPALEPLSNALFSEDRRTRRAALSALKQMRIDLAPVLGKLVDALDTTDLDFAGGVLALIETTGRAALPHLDVVAPFVSCGHKDASVRALGILVVLAPESRTELSRVLQLAADAEPRQRRRAVETAIRIAPDDGRVVKALAAELGRASDRDRRLLLEAARRLRPDAPGFAALVVRYTKDSAAEVRNEAARLLEAIVLEDVTRLDALIAMLSDTDAKVRSRAAASIEGVGSVAADAVAPLTKLLENGDLTDDLDAVKALAAIGPAALPAFPAVLGMLERMRPSRDMQQAVVRFVASDPAMAVEALSSEQEGARQVAFQSLCGWRPEDWEAQLPEVLKPLGRALLSAPKATPMDRAVLDGVAPFAGAEPRVTAMFVSLAGATCPEMRHQAARQVALRRENIPLLVELLQSSYSAERGFALRAFGYASRFLREPEALVGLLALLRSDDEVARGLAGRVLIGNTSVAGAALGDEDADALARAASDLLGDESLWEASLGCLTNLGERSLPHLDGLFALLADDGLRQRNTRAAYALRLIAMGGEKARLAVLPKARAVLEGDDAIAAAAAAHVLAIFDEHVALLLARLPELMRDERKRVHFNAVSAAEAMENHASPLVPVLLEIAQDPPGGSHVDTWAVNALSRIARDDERLMRLAVAGLLDRKRQGLRPLFENAIRRGGENAARALADALAGADASGKLLLLAQLANLGRKAAPALDQVRSLLKDPDARVAKAAAELVERIAAYGPRRQD